MGEIDWSQCADVESVPEKLGGAWVLRDTRMPVQIVLDNLDAGATIDDLLEWFDGLDRRQLGAVINYAANHLQAAAHQ